MTVIRTELGDITAKIYADAIVNAANGTIVDFMTIYSKEDISVTFKDGTEIHIG